MCNLTLGLWWVGWPIYADFPTFLRIYVNHRDEHEHLDYLLSNAFLILYSLLLTWIDCQRPIGDLLVTLRRLDCIEIGWHSTCVSVRSTFIVLMTREFAAIGSSISMVQLIIWMTWGWNLWIRFIYTCSVGPLVTFLLSKLNFGPSVCWGMLHPMPSWAVDVCKSLTVWRSVCYLVLTQEGKERILFRGWCKVIPASTNLKPSKVHLV